MKIQHIIAASALFGLISLSSCSRQEVESPIAPKADPNATEVTFTAEAASPMEDPETKTMFSPTSDTKILWSPYDEISVFYGTSGVNNHFVSENAEPITKTTFTGHLSAFTGENDGGEALSFWGVYPYSPDNTSDGNSVTVKMKTSVKGLPDNIERGSLITIAKSFGLNLSFKNAGSGFKLSFVTPGIEKVVITADAGEILAGTIKVSMNSSGVPVIEEVADGTSTIEIDLSDNPSEPGKFYYIPAIPGVLADGITMKLYTDTKVATYVHGKSVTLNRSRWGKFADKDNGLTWVDRTDIPSSNEIWYKTKDNGKATFYSAGWDSSIYGGTGSNTLVNDYYDSELGVRRMVFSDDVIYVGDMMFIRDPATNEDSAYNMENLTEVILPNSVKYVGVASFLNLENLVSVKLGNSLEGILPSAFAGCLSLSKIKFPSTLTSISFRAFAYCQSLESVSLPSGMQHIGIEFSPESETELGNPFIGCQNIKSFSGAFASDDGMFLTCEFKGNNTLVAGAMGSLTSTCVVPDGIVNIASYAFNGGQFSSVTLPATLKKIGDLAFSDCFNLGGSIEIPSEVTKIGEYAFLNTNFTQVKFLASEILPDLGQDAFGAASEISTKFHIPGWISSNMKYHNYMTTDEVWNGYRNRNLIRIYQADDELWYITSSQSYYSDSSIPTLFSTVTDENGDAAVLWGMVTPATFGGGANLIPAGSSITTSFNVNGRLIVYKYRAPLKTVGEEAFKDRTTLTYVSLPNTVETIGASAFSGCTALYTAPFGSKNTITTVSESAFLNCSAMSGSVRLNNATSIGEKAFQGCAKIGWLYFGEITSIPSYMADGCTLLRKVVLKSPLSVKTVGAYAFHNCSALTAVAGTGTSDGVILDGVTSVSTYGFMGCTSLTTAFLSNAISLASHAFDGCTSLSSVIVPKVKSVGSYAFHSCTSLAGIDLPVATKLLSYSFSGCTSLATVSVPKVTTLGNYAFGGGHKIVTLRLPAVTSIGTGALGAGMEITHIIIGTAITSMTNSLFNYPDISSLKKPEIRLAMAARTPPTISDDTFSNCCPRYVILKDNTIATAYARAWVEFSPIKDLPTTVLRTFFTTNTSI